MNGGKKVLSPGGRQMFVAQFISASLFILFYPKHSSKFMRFFMGKFHLIKLLNTLKAFQKQRIVDDFSCCEQRGWVFFFLAARLIPLNAIYDFSYPFSRP